MVLPAVQGGLAPVSFSRCRPSALVSQNTNQCATWSYVLALRVNIYLQELKRCTKQFRLWRMPNILIVQLKRFSTTNVRTNNYYGTVATTEKITTPVDFPDELDLTECAH